MSLDQTPQLPNLNPPYQDPQRPNGVGPVDGPAPDWFQQAMQDVTKAIFEVVHHSQHEYLDRRRLPHSIKMSEVLVKPHLLSTGEVVVQTAFPVASDRTFVAFYTPLFTNGANQMAGDPIPDETVEVGGYTVFAYKEGVFTAAKNEPQRLSPMVIDELSRQAKELKLRHVQFLYFTFMQPQYPDAFDDPHGHLPKLIGAHTAEMARRAEAPWGAQQPKQDTPASVQMPTEL